MSRGEEAHRAAKLQGDRAIEFLAAGGVALTPARARRRRRAPSAGSAWPARRRRMAPSREPGPPARDVAGMARAAAAMRRACARHLERAVTMATESGGRPRAARPWPAWRSRPRGSSAPATRAHGGPRPAAGGARRALGGAGEGAAAAPAGHAPWGAQADAALATRRPRPRRRRGAAWPAARRSRPSRPALHEDASLEIVSRRPGPSSPARRPEMQAVRPRTTSSSRCRGSPRARPTRTSASGG